MADPHVVAGDHHPRCVLVIGPAADVGESEVGLAAGCYASDAPAHPAFERWPTKTSSRHGLPLIVTGGQEDKPEVAARVAWSGAGIRFKQLSPGPEALRDAVRTVLADDTYRAAARRLSVSMERAPSLDALAQLIADLTAV